MHTHPNYIFPKLRQHGDFMIILSKLSTQHGDPLGGTLFVLAHFLTIRLIITTHPTCVFLSSVDDIHIVSFASDVVPRFL